MRISIVIPVLDEERRVAGALFPLQAARVAGEVEIVVVDGGSGDGSVTSARPLADAVIDTPPGRALQMNAGAAVASGDVLVFLHVDTELPSGWRHAIREAVDTGAQWGRFDVEIDGSPRVLGVVAAMMNLRSRLTGIATGDQAIFVTRRAFDAAGRFPEIPLMEDLALSRALKRTAGRPRCLSLKVRTSGRRWEQHGPWRTIALMWWLRASYFLGADPASLAAIYRRRPSRG
jgi:rSAM/selenodomain-associated transferase 2